MTLWWLFHSDTMVNFAHWDCCDCSTVTLLRLFHNDTGSIVAQWNCCDCSTVTLLSLFYSNTVMIVPQWHCYNCSTVTVLRLFHSNSFEIEILWTVNFVPQWNSLLKNNNLYQEYGTWSATFFLLDVCIFTSDEEKEEENQLLSYFWRMLLKFQDKKIRNS